MNTMTHINGPTILLSSGVYFNYEQPHTSDFSIIDIAKGLSNTCRFGGQSPRYYSVAEHCVLMSRVVGHAFSFEALMHDAAEAFICDMPKPLKQLLPDYKVVEDRVEAAICERYNLPVKISSSVKNMDIRMLAAEQTQVMGNSHDWAHTHGLEAAPVTIEFWEPLEAYAKFLERFKQLNKANT
ncbi:MAG: hypothetical protein ABJO86_00840 [Lentilitoribacter sp.]